MPTATPATPASYFSGTTPPGTTSPASYPGGYATTPASHSAGYGATSVSQLDHDRVQVPAPQMSAQAMNTPSWTLEAAQPNTMFLKSDVDTVTRRTLAFAHTFVLAALFFPPFVLSLCMGLNDEVAYFAGRRSLAPILLLPFLVIVPIVHLVSKPKRATFYLTTVLIPAILFASVGGSLRETTEIAANAMYNRDCFTFAEKRSLFRAHQAALEVHSTCQGSNTAVEHCQGYDAVQKTYVRELKYLSSLERRFQCAGICHSSIQLFQHPGEEAPTCGLFVAQWLMGAADQAYAVLWYAIFIILISWPSWLLFVKPVVDRVP